MLNEHVVVRATKDLSDNVLAGCKGTIVYVYVNPRPAYEVEFVNNAGDTIELLTVYPADVEA